MVAISVIGLIVGFLFLDLLFRRLEGPGRDGGK